jgi:hypothetical protein
MKIGDIIAALELPPESRVDLRVAKKLLVENGAPTAADKRQINEGMEELLWLAALKPTTIGVPEYRDPVREYLEIAVLSLKLRPGAKAGRLVELVHRAIPYPVLLVTEQTNALTISVAHKRWSMGEAGKVVLDDSPILIEFPDGSMDQQFLAGLSLTVQARDDLLALYQGWIDCLETFKASRITGSFIKQANRESADNRHDALGEYERLTRQIASLRAQAAHESQLNRRVELNLKIKSLEIELANARSHL